MPADTPPPLRAGALIGCEVRARDGRPLGRIADLETSREPDGRERITAAIVTGGRWGRLLGYERDQHTGPWLLERLAHHVIRRHTRHVPWTDLQLPPMT
ncbi:PRC-barrel domain-containing protein [Actinoplanes sp. NPDC049548]|uniref:PRC-barrel domain-containing protein n=1 Tax=Actinoplanes sp. NPDC049548 TaxID=3155152 RepID=UPI003415BD34